MPIKVNNSENDILIKQAENKNLLTVDLPKQVISCGSEININFDIDPFRKKCLLEGLDDIALTLKKSEKIVIILLSIVHIKVLLYFVVVGNFVVALLL